MDTPWPVTSIRLPPEAIELLDAAKRRMPHPSRSLVILTALLEMTPGDPHEAAKQAALRTHIARSGLGLTPVATPAAVPPRLR